MDRPLAKPLHFKAVVGQQVKIKMASSIDGRRRFTGELIEATDEFAVVEVDGEQSELPYSDMDRARLIPVYNFD
jgi:ribosome maturation factor RimP